MNKFVGVEIPTDVYVEVAHPRFGYMSFALKSPPFPCDGDESVKACVPFWCVSRQSELQNAKLIMTEVKVFEASVYVPTLTNTKKVAKGDKIVAPESKTSVAELYAAKHAEAAAEAEEHVVGQRVELHLLLHDELFPCPWHAQR